MRFDGINFYLAPSVVQIPYSKRADDDPREDNYVRFGRRCREGVPGSVPFGTVPDPDRPNDPNAVVPVYATPVEIEGWSLTNMAYGKDGKVYLKYGGRCYTGRVKPRAA